MKISLDKPADLALYLESADGLVLLFGQGQIGLKPERMQMVIDSLRHVDRLERTMAELEQRTAKLERGLDKLARKAATLEAIVEMILNRS